MTSAPRVYTFNAARNPLSTGFLNPGQINIIVPGDEVGDAQTGKLVGTGFMPGVTYSIRSPTDDGRALSGHSIVGIIGGLAESAR